MPIRPPFAPHQDCFTGDAGRCYHENWLLHQIIKLERVQRSDFTDYFGCFSWKILAYIHIQYRHVNTNKGT